MDKDRIHSIYSRISDFLSIKDIDKMEDLHKGDKNKVKIKAPKFLEKFKNKQKRTEKLWGIKPELWLVFILIFALVLRLIFFVGLVCADPQDDGIYMSNVHSIFRGHYNLDRYKGENLLKKHLANPAETFSFRIGLLYPCTLFSLLFGISDFSMTLFSLLCSLGGIVLAFYFGKFIFNRNVGLIAAFLLSFFPLDVMYATRIAVDVPLAFFVLLSLYLFLTGRDRYKDKYKFTYRTYSINKGSMYLFLSGLTLGIGYLVKPMAIILIGFYFIYVLYDLLRKRPIKIFFYIILGFLIILTIEGTYYYLQTGHFFLHKEIVTRAYLFKYEVENVRVIDITDQIRISYTDGYPFYYSDILLNKWHHRPNVNYFGYFPYFVILSILYLLIKRIKEAYVLIFLVLFLFLYLEFGTAYIHFNFEDSPIVNYLMLFKNPRFLTLLIVPSLIILAYPLTKTKKIFSIIIICFLFITSIHHINESRNFFLSNVRDMKEAVSFLKEQPQKEIYCDYLCAGILQYYFGFKRDGYIQNIGTIKNPDQIKDSFVLVGGVRGEVNTAYVMSITPDFAKNPPKNWILVKEIPGKIDGFRQNNAKIYYVP